MRIKPEAVIKDIEEYLSENYELPWGNAQAILIEAQILIESQERVIKELEKTLSIMEGEYPEPTVFAKITEFNSLEEAYNRIVELEQAIKDADEWLESGEGVSLCYYSFSDSNPKSIKIIKEITE